MKGDYFMDTTLDTIVDLVNDSARLAYQFYVDHDMARYDRACSGVYTLNELLRRLGHPEKEFPMEKLRFGI